MKKRILIVFTSVLGSMASGQDYVTRELMILKGEKSLLRLKHRVDSLVRVVRADKAEYKTNSWSTNVLDNYYETNVAVNVAIPHGAPGVYHDLSFRFCILNKGDSVFYSKVRESGHYPEVFGKTLYSYSDSVILKRFHSDYEEFYSCKVDPDDFFLKTDVYGKSCTQFREPPPSRVIIETRISKADTTFINSWLGSATIEKQIYAVEALIRLKRSGMRLSARQERLMAFIKKRNVKVSVCNGGCSNLSLSPGQALAYFDSSEGGR